MWRKGFPRDDGFYLVVRKVEDELIYEVVGYSNNLCKVDKLSFKYEKKKGWYKRVSDLDIYYRLEDVVAWQPIKSYTRRIR